MPELTSQQQQQQHQHQHQSTTTTTTTTTTRTLSFFLSFFLSLFVCLVVSFFVCFSYLFFLPNSSLLPTPSVKTILLCLTTPVTFHCALAAVKQCDDVRPAVIRNRCVHLGSSIGTTQQFLPLSAFLLTPIQENVPLSTNF